MENLGQQDDSLLLKVAPQLKPAMGIIENIVPIMLVIGGIYVVTTLLETENKGKKPDDGDGVEGLIRKARKAGVKV